MKSIRKASEIIALTAIIILSTSFILIPSNSVQVVTSPGIFQKYNDYLTHHLTKYDELSLGHNSYTGIIGGKQISTTLYQDVDFWGIESDKGIIYRVNKRANIIDQIITTGEICFYGGVELSVIRNFDGSIKSMEVHGEKGSKFSDIFWISLGGEKDMIGASLDNLYQYFADSQDIVTKANKVGIDETNMDKWPDNITNISGWINEYNQAHK